MSDINELIIIIFTHVSDNKIYCHSICRKNFMQSRTSYSPVASFSGLPRGGGKAWYTLFAHALDFPNIPGIPYHVQISPRCYMSLSYTLA